MDNLKQKSKIIDYLKVDDVSISNTKDKADIQWLQLTVQSLQSIIKSKEGQMNEKINHLEEVTMDNHGYLDNVNSTLQLEVQARCAQ